MSKAKFLLAGLCVVTAASHAQSLPYADADNPSQAVGMMALTLKISSIMKAKCEARFPALQPMIDAQIEQWHKLDRVEIAATERHFQAMLKLKPDLGRQIDEAAVQGYESKLVAPFRSAAPEVERKIVGDYCAQFFRELASGVWRQRTPKLYQYLAQK